jgi:NADH dehydrogenase
MAPTRRPGDSFARVDRDGHLALFDEAKQAGVRRIIYMSISPALPATNPFVAAKRAVESAVRESGLTWTILQPTAFMEVHLGAPAGWDYRTGRARYIGSDDRPMRDVSIRDVAAMAALAVTSPKADNRALHFGGPEELTARGAVALAERVTGRPFRVQALPGPVARVLGLLVKLFSPQFAAILDMTMATPVDVPIDMTRVLADFPIAQTTFEEYVRAHAAESR